MTQKNKANKNALSYFISLHEPRPTDSQEFSPQRWDQRAEFWKKERIKKRKGDEGSSAMFLIWRKRGFSKSILTLQILAVVQAVLSLPLPVGFTGL